MNVPSLTKETKMGIKDLVGKKMTKVVKFMGEDLKISKLSVAEVMQIQESAKSVDNNDERGFDILKTVISSAAEGGKDLSNEDFDNFPMDELSKLSNEIMKFSGIGGDEKGK
jgi:hypothetical protein